MTTTQATDTLQGLAERLRGDLIRPGDAAYDAARRVWNGMYDAHPAAVARAEGAVDVVAVVEYARATGTELAVRGGGHSSAGYSTVDGGIVLDLSRMRGVRVDPSAKVAWAQAGALWGDVDRETQAHELAVPGGQISHTGIAGLTLGGGIGWLSRKHGLTIDNLLSVDLVTADGRLVTASATENPDLFWGLRGGSGNFGVAVSFEYRLHDVGPLVLGGPLFYALDDAPAVLRNAREAMAAAPDDVSLWLVLTHLPPVPPFPEEHHGAPVLAVVPFCTDLERGPALLEPLTGFGSPLASLHGPIPYTALQSALDDVDPHGHRYWERGDYLAGLSDGLIDALVEGARTVSSPRSEILLFPMGGAIARVPEGGYGVRRPLGALGSVDREPVDRSRGGRAPPRLDTCLLGVARAVDDGRGLRQRDRRRRDRGAEGGGVRRAREARAAAGAEAQVGSGQPLPPEPQRRSVRSGARRDWRNSRHVPRGAPDHRDAASSVAPVSSDTGAPCVLASRRPAAPGKRGPFRQSLLVAEDGRALVDPLPERRRAAEPGVRDELALVELAGREADRADQELAAALGVLLEQVRQRRAAVACDPLRASGQADPDGVLREEHHDLLAARHGRGGDEERNGHALRVLEPCGQVDDDLVFCAHQLSSQRRR